jgi:tetratricopeptide (TPR) repeat protein
MPMVVSPSPKNKPVRTAVLLPLLGEDEPVRSPARQGHALNPPKDTRLAMASPAVPKDEARIERRPTDARDDLVRAGEAMSIGRTSDAIVLLRKVIQAEPENERARLALLSLLAERGRDDTWRATLADSAKALPRRFGLAAAQGMAESGRFEDSLAILQGLPESVRDTRYFSALGATHQQLNQHAEAVAAFDAALNTAPGSSPPVPSLLVAQAMSMQSMGKVADARRNLERVRQMPEAAADVREFATRELAHSR